MSNQKDDKTEFTIRSQIIKTNNVLYLISYVDGVYAFDSDYLMHYL